jgi:hypothetical protein
VGKSGYQISPYRNQVRVSAVDKALTFKGVTADGSPGVKTTKLTLEFNEDIEDFTLAHIALSGALDNGGLKTLTKTGKGVYEISLYNIGSYNITGTGEVTVKVSLSGYFFPNGVSSHTVTVYAGSTGPEEPPPATTYNLGDTGPGGGKIFYYDAAGFTCYTSAADTTGIICHYLEAAPADITDLLMTDFSSPTETAIGTGRRNTAIILASNANHPSARACNEYSSNGKTDWFLPSRQELNELYTNRASVGGKETSSFLSSSSSYESYRYKQLVINFSSNGNWFVGSGYFDVRAVRAF